MFVACMVCHGDGAQSGGITPDLRWSKTGASKASWSAVVMDGERASVGMAGFKGALSAEDIESVRAYVVARAHEDAPPPPKKGK
jgi:mono/diheme cytochrome c family protein